MANVLSGEMFPDSQALEAIMIHFL